jgi:hypothetical protein
MDGFLKRLKSLSSFTGTAKVHPLKSTGKTLHSSSDNEMKEIKGGKKRTRRVKHRRSKHRKSKSRRH